MSSQLIDRSHPVTEFAGRLSARLDQLADVATWTMRPEEHRAALKDLAKAEAQLAAIRLRVLGEAERSGATDAQAAASAAEWLAVETRQTRLAARSDKKLSKALEHHDELATALGAGRANIAQARAIVKALDQLPSSGEFAVTQQQRQQAEQHLVGLAAEYDAKALTLLGRHLFEVVAPDLAERFERKSLEAEEAAPAGSETVVASDRSLDGDDTLYVDYGSTCGFFEGTCGAELELQIVRWSHPFAAVDKCRRQLPVVRGGAVAVETDYEVDIFTGDVVIRLEQITWDGLGNTVAAALRDVGDKTAHEPLPEPTPAAMASIDARCGETPPEGTTIR